MTRRRALTGLGVAVLAAAGLMAFDLNPAVPQTTSLVARRAPDDPGLDPSAGAWDQAEAVDVALTAQEVAYPFGGGTTPSVSAKALYRDRTLYLRLEWDDSTRDVMTDETQTFADGLAIEFPSKAGSSVPSVCMGQADGGVNIWQWRADRQQRSRSWPQGFFPNGYVDEYPMEGKLAYPARYVDNIVAQTHRVAQDLVAEGFGTLGPAAKQSVEASGAYSDSGSGSWAVVFRRPFAKPGTDQPGFSTNGKLDVAFAVWNGAKGERNGVKSVSQFGRLVISPGGQPSAPWNGWWLVTAPGVALALVVLWRMLRVRRPRVAESPEAP